MTPSPTSTQPNSHSLCSNFATKHTTISQWQTEQQTEHAPALLYRLAIRENEAGLLADATIATSVAEEVSNGRRSAGRQTTGKEEKKGWSEVIATVQDLRGEIDPAKMTLNLRLKEARLKTNLGAPKARANRRQWRPQWIART